MLLDYLHLMRDGSEPPPLGPKLARVFANPEDALTRHINTMEVERVPVTTAQKTTGGLFGDKRMGP